MKNTNKQLLSTSMVFCQKVKYSLQIHPKQRTSIQEHITLPNAFLKATKPEPDFTMFLASIFFQAYFFIYYLFLRYFYVFLSYDQKPDLNTLGAYKSFIVTYISLVKH